MVLIKTRNIGNWFKDICESIKALDTDALEHMIYVSCNIKREVVENDPNRKREKEHCLISDIRTCYRERDESALSWGALCCP